MTCSRGKSARSRKVAHGLEIHECRAQPVDVLLFEDERGEQPQDRRIAGSAGEDVARQQRLLHIFGGFVQLEAARETRALEAASPDPPRMSS